MPLATDQSANDPVVAAGHLFKPKKRTARVSSTIEKSILVRADQFLDGGDVLPGFTVKLSDLLDRGRRPRRG
jgi:hypothetical protein